jgi:hypothetical protein
MNQLVSLVDDKFVDIKAVVYEPKILPKFKRFFGNGHFKQFMQAFENEEIITVVRFAEYTVFHIRFGGDVSIKYITSQTGQWNPVFATKAFEQTISRSSISKLPVIAVSGESMEFRNGDVVLEWKGQLFYKTGTKYWKALIVDKKKIVLEDTKTDRPFLVNLTGLGGEF